MCPSGDSALAPKLCLTTLLTNHIELVAFDKTLVVKTNTALLHYLGSLLEHRLGHRFAKTLSTASDEHYLVCQLHGEHSSDVWWWLWW